MNEGHRGRQLAARLVGGRPVDNVAAAGEFADRAFPSGLLPIIPASFRQFVGINPVPTPIAPILGRAVARREHLRCGDGENRMRAPCRCHGSGPRSEGADVWGIASRSWIRRPVCPTEPTANRVRPAPEHATLLPKIHGYPYPIYGPRDRVSRDLWRVRIFPEGKRIPVIVCTELPDTPPAS